jgi:hypothetical protein
MASNKFDELTRALASSTSRRQTIKAILASALGGALAFGSLGTALAKCGAKGDPCKADGDCCTYTCNKTIQRCDCRNSGATCSHNYECCSVKCSPTSNKCV